VNRGMRRGGVVKIKKELNEAIDRLADLIEYGHLLAATGNGVDLLNAAADEIIRLRAPKAVPIPIPSEGKTK